MTSALDRPKNRPITAHSTKILLTFKYSINIKITVTLTKHYLSMTSLCVWHVLMHE